MKELGLPNAAKQTEVQGAAAAAALQPVTPGPQADAVSEAFHPKVDTRASDRSGSPVVSPRFPTSTPLVGRVEVPIHKEAAGDRQPVGNQQTELASQDELKAQRGEPATIYRETGDASDTTHPGRVAVPNDAVEQTTPTGKVRQAREGRRQEGVDRPTPSAAVAKPDGSAGDVVSGGTKDLSRSTGDRRGRVRAAIPVVVDNTSGSSSSGDAGAGGERPSEKEREVKRSGGDVPPPTNPPGGPRRAAGMPDDEGGEGSKPQSSRNRGVGRPQARERIKGVDRPDPYKVDPIRLPTDQARAEQLAAIDKRADAAFYERENVRTRRPVTPHTFPTTDAPDRPNTIDLERRAFFNPAYMAQMRGGLSPDMAGGIRGLTAHGSVDYYFRVGTAPEHGIGIRVQVQGGREVPYVVIRHPALEHGVITGTDVRAVAVKIRQEANKRRRVAKAFSRAETERKVELRDLYDYIETEVRPRLGL